MTWLTIRAKTSRPLAYTKVSSRGNSVIHSCQSSMIASIDSSREVSDEKVDMLVWDSCYCLMLPAPACGWWPALMRSVSQLLRPEPHCRMAVSCRGPTVACCERVALKRNPSELAWASQSHWQLANRCRLDRGNFYLQAAVCQARCQLLAGNCLLCALYNLVARVVGENGVAPVQCGERGDQLQAADQLLKAVLVLLQLCLHTLL